MFILKPYLVLLLVWYLHQVMFGEGLQLLSIRQDNQHQLLTVKLGCLSVIEFNLNLPSSRNVRSLIWKVNSEGTIPDGTLFQRDSAVLLIFILIFNFGAPPNSGFPPTPKINRCLKEKPCQNIVGWKVYHYRFSRRKSGLSTKDLCYYGKNESIRAIDYAIRKKQKSQPWLVRLDQKSTYLRSLNRMNITIDIAKSDRGQITPIEGNRRCFVLKSMFMNASPIGMVFQRPWLAIFTPISLCTWTCRSEQDEKIDCEVGWVKSRRSSIRWSQQRLCIFVLSLLTDPLDGWTCISLGPNCDSSTWGNHVGVEEGFTIIIMAPQYATGCACKWLHRIFSLGDFDWSMIRLLIFSQMPSTWSLMTM